MPMIEAVEIVSEVILYMMVCLFGIYPLLQMFTRLIHFCSNVFDTRIVQKCEGKGFSNVLTGGESGSFSQVSMQKMKEV